MHLPLRAVYLDACIYIYIYVKERKKTDVHNPSSRRYPNIHRMCARGFVQYYHVLGIHVRRTRILHNVTYNIYVYRCSIIFVKPHLYCVCTLEGQSDTTMSRIDRSAYMYT